MIRFIALMVALVWVAPAMAITSPWSSSDLIDGTPPIQGRLISATDGRAGLGEIEAGLQIRLADGWKTYWRTPGEVGLPPVLDWSQSLGVDDVSHAFPAPTRFSAFGIENFGYGEEVVLPLLIKPSSDSDAVYVKLDAQFLVCADICVPATLNLNLFVDNNAPAIDEDSARLISKYQSHVPDQGERTGFSLYYAQIDPNATNVIRVAFSAPTPFENPDVFPEYGDNLGFGKPGITHSEDRTELFASLPLSSSEVVIGEPIRLTIVDGDRASTFETVIEKGGDFTTIATGSGSGSLAETGFLPEQKTSLGLWHILGLAFLGGLILNIMPCVLPVLSLKLTSIVGYRDRDLGHIRVGFLASAAGIITSMLIIALITISLKSSGAAVGWGVQFQNATFLVFMVILLTLFAANLAGIFEIQLPGFLSTSLATTGGSGLAGDFTTGAFATLLATPCSAPFLGTAVGFALSGSNSDIFLVFLMLGIGLATPYWLVALRPQLVRFLPRPGNWMIWFRHVLSAALAATALWLLWVLSTVESLPVGMLLGFSMLLLVCALIMVGGATKTIWRQAAGVLGLLALILGFSAPRAVAYFNPEHKSQVLASSSRDLDRTEADTSSGSESKWVDFDVATIPRLVAEGQTVFVDVTADWCITCKANKFLVLDTGEIAEMLQADDLTAMRADWTKPNPSIARYLEKYGRYGIPFNIVYGPAMPEGIALPELLSKDAVLDAINRAGQS